MHFVQTDGGRAAAGFRGSADDCVTRAIAVASGLPYREVYDELNRRAKSERHRKKRLTSNARTGVHRHTYHDYLIALGFRWVPCMEVGKGCTIHLKSEELPQGVLVVSLSRHLAAVINGVLHDNHDSSRDGTRCVYGYYHKGGLSDANNQTTTTADSPRNLVVDSPARADCVACSGAPVHCCG